MEYENDTMPALSLSQERLHYKTQSSTTPFKEATFNRNLREQPEELIKNSINYEKIEDFNQSKPNHEYSDIKLYLQKKEEFLCIFFNCKDIHPYFLSVINDFISSNKYDNYKIFKGGFLCSSTVKNNIIKLIDTFKKRKEIDIHQFQKFCLDNATPLFYAEMISIIKNAINNNPENQLPAEKVDILSLLINKYNELIEVRNTIIINNQTLIKNIVKRAFPDANKDDLELLQSYGMEALIKSIFNYDCTKGTSFMTFLNTKIPYLVIDILRENDYFYGKRKLLLQSKSHILKKIQDQKYITKQQENELQQIENDINDLILVTKPQSLYSDEDIVNDNDGPRKLSAQNSVYDHHNNLKTVEINDTINNTFKYLYGDELYLIKLRFNFYPTSKYGETLKLSYNYLFKHTMDKLKNIIKTHELKVSPREKREIKTRLQSAILTHNFKYPDLILRHFGLIDGKCYTRAKLSEMYNMPIFSVDKYIYKVLKECRSFSFIQLYSMSLDIEKKKKTPEMLKKIDNIKIFLSDEELEFYTYRFDFKKNVIRNFSDLAQFLHTTEENLIKLERNFIDKLKFFEPELYKKILKMHKNSIKNDIITNNFVRNSLFLLNDIQFDIINLYRGITTQKPLSKNEIMKELSLSESTFDKEFKSAKKILRKHLPLNLRSKFLRISYRKAYDKDVKEIFKLKFIDLLSPQEIAKKLNISLDQYLSLEQDILKKGVIFSRRKRSQSEKKLLKIYQKSFLNNKTLSYKDKLENSLFVLKSQRISQTTLMVIIYSFGLFGNEVKSTKEIAQLLNKSLAKIAEHRREGIKRINSYLNIPYINQLCYSKALPNLKKPLPSEMIKSIEQEICKIINKLNPLDSEIFYRNYGLRFCKKETYNEISYKLKLSKDYINESLKNSTNLVKSSFPTNTFLHFLICKNQNDKEVFFYKIEILDEVVRYIHLFKENTQQAINIIFGLSNNNLQINSEIQKINMPEGTFYQYQREILPIFEILLSIKFKPNDTLLYRQTQRKSSIIKTTPTRDELLDIINTLPKKNMKFLLYRFFKNECGKSIKDCAKHFSKSTKDICELETKSINLLKSKIDFIGDISLVLADNLHLNNEFTPIESLENYLFILNEREQKIISLLFGLFDEKMHTQMKICEKCGLKSASYISALKNRILNKLSKYIDTRELLIISKDRNNKKEKQ